MYTDTSFTSVASVHNNTCMQNWTDGLHYSLFYPMRSKAEAPTTITKMVHHMRGIPEVIVSDYAKEESSREWYAEVRALGTRHHITEPYSHWQNWSERDIEEIKFSITHATRRKNSPKRLWDFCGEWVAAVRHKTAHNLPELQGMSPEENVHGQAADISAYAQFDWYKPVWYID